MLVHAIAGDKASLDAKADREKAGKLALEFFKQLGLDVITPLDRIRGACKHELFGGTADYLVIHFPTQWICVKGRVYRVTTICEVHRFRIDKAQDARDWAFEIEKPWRFQTIVWDSETGEQVGYEFESDCYEGVTDLRQIIKDTEWYLTTDIDKLCKDMASDITDVVLDEFRRVGLVDENGNSTERE
tara:strand:- start:1919 stop:2479 length:561 start_codon:yes stop_codon:yes gene_type:complete